VIDPGGNFDRRVRVGAAGVRQPAEVLPPELGDPVSITRARWVGRLALTIAVLAAVGGVALAVAAVADPVTVRWGTGAILLVLLAATVLFCAHAGGHAWFVPLPAFALAALWAFTASARSPAAGWWLLTLSAVACGGAVVIAGTALRQRFQASLVVCTPVRGASGAAVTALSPVGVVQVGGETWSAESVSGTLPAGVPVHVLSVRGVRLLVWSEVGTVPGASVIDIKEDQP
jgi:membrane-bound ClpP family serine protease